MKIKAIITFIIFTSLFTFSSCTEDNSLLDDIIGSDTEDLIGTWSVTDNASKLNYTVVISEDGNDYSSIIMSNFADSDGSASALVVGNSITIETQTIGQGWKVSGTGTKVSDNRLTFVYELEIAGSSETRSAIFTR